MFNLIFGIVWTLFSSIFFVIIVISSFTTSSNLGDAGLKFNFSMIIPVIMISIFLIVGVVLIVKGAKKVIKDSKTKKYGVPCYGIVQNISQTGAYVNERPEYKAILDIVNPNTNQIESIEEIVGFNYNKYPIGSYVYCKYYEGDINIENNIGINELPGSYKDMLKPINYTSNASNTYNNSMGYTDIVFSDDREYVTIDGVKYRKVY